MDEAQITITYNSLVNAMQAHYLASEAAASARVELETARLGAMRDGLITGKNEDERKMKTWEVLPELCHKAAVAEAEERKAKYLLDVAQVLVEQVRAELRLAETKARVVLSFPGMTSGEAAELINRIG